MINKIFCKHEWDEATAIKVQSWADAADEWIFVTTCKKCGKTKIKKNTFGFSNFLMGVGMIFALLIISDTIKSLMGV